MEHDRAAADVLNRYSISTRSRKGDKSWTSNEVSEREKQHEARAFLGPRSKLRDARRELVEKWNALYYQVPPRAGSNAKR